MVLVFPVGLFLTKCLTWQSGPCRGHGTTCRSACICEAGLFLGSSGML